MFFENKNTEIFYFADKFCNFFNLYMKNLCLSLLKMIGNDIINRTE